MNLDGAHVVITGGSRGIGAATADRFAARGARVTVVARSVDELRDVAERTAGSWIAADLTDAETVSGLVARIENEHGPVDVLVNNAGIDLTGPFVEMGSEDLERIVRLNAITVADLTRQVIPGMVERGRGHIVQVSSLAGCGVFPGLAVYSATKAFITHMTAGIRLELQGLPVGLTVVEAGLVTPTDMAESVTSYPPTRASFRRFYRLGLLVDTDVNDLADAIVTAVEQGKRSVRRPRRAVLFPLLTAAPRRIVELLLPGVPRRGDR